MGQREGLRRKKPPDSPVWVKNRANPRKAKWKACEPIRSSRRISNAGTSIALLRSALGLSQERRPRRKSPTAEHLLLMRGCYVRHVTCDRLLEPRSSRELRYRARRQLKSGTRDDDRLLGARRLRVCKRILGTTPPLSQLEI